MALEHHEDEYDHALDDPDTEAEVEVQDDEPYSFEAARDDEDTVACARCGRQIWAHAQRCPHCGVYFHGEAWEFQQAGAPRRPAWWWWVAVGLLIMVALFVLLRGQPF